MSDKFKQTRRHDWFSDNSDARGIGHTEQRNAYRKKERRRARRVLKQDFRKELRDL